MEYVSDFDELEFASESSGRRERLRERSVYGSSLDYRVLTNTQIVYLLFCFSFCEHFTTATNFTVVVIVVVTMMAWHGIVIARP
ncbi:unnamed protein product [Orchesella dallaii]|uniref:Uncharacterized protein n=1 Tax=Orchesella dallaii TaxID=48710 RepID=A0ABP1RSW6_9HEXA